MAGQGFDPDFIFTWPRAGLGVMEGESAVMALFSGEMENSAEAAPDEDGAEMDSVRRKYERELDARYCGGPQGLLMPSSFPKRLAQHLRSPCAQRSTIPARISALCIPETLPGISGA